MDEALYPDTMNPVNVKVLDFLSECMENMDICSHVMWCCWPAAPPILHDGQTGKALVMVLLIVAPQHIVPML